MSTNIVTNQASASLANTSLMNTYGRYPIAFSHGQGVWLFDVDGNKYIDAISGIGVCALGHNYPSVTEAIGQQASQLLHTSNLFHIGKQQVLADKLTALSGMENCFFSNSGAEANEAAIKIARLFGHQQGIETPTIIVFEQSFHGRTMATLSASGNRKIQAGFEPLVKGFIRAPFNNIDAIKNIATNNSNVVAVLIETIQGEGGLNVADDDYLAELHHMCQEKNWLLMLDEVQTGNGRTGHYFSYQGFDWTPDVVTTAKGLGNGVPIGACLAKGKAAGILQPGTHGSTFGGNPLACAAANATVEAITSKDLINNAKQMGNYIIQTLVSRINDHTSVVEIRGKGLMIGIELNRDCPELVIKAMEKGLLINVTNSRVIRLLPPLIIEQKEANLLIDVICHLIDDTQ